MVSPTLLAILRLTLSGVERSFKSPQDQPAIRELKTALMLALGELEIARVPNDEASKNEAEV